MKIKMPTNIKLIIAAHSLRFLLGCGIVLSFVPLTAFASNFSINPTSQELSSSIKSGALTVINSENDKLNCQIDVKEWSQDKDGKDVYTDTKEIIFFPKIMVVEPNEQRAIRIGITVPAGVREKTYRLFVEEIPSQKREAGSDESAKRINAGLTIAFRYAVPIFVVPAQPQQSVVIEKVDLSRGMATAIIKNEGNIHAKFLSVVFTGKSSGGKELFSKDLAGWYILQGVSCRYETTVPKEVCNELATIEVSAKAEKFTINGNLNVKKQMCGH